MAKLLAIRSACRLAITYGWHNATVESDSKVAISLAFSKVKPPRALAAIVVNIKAWASQLAISFFWAKRKCNLAAHRVAKISFRSLDLFLILLPELFIRMSFDLHGLPPSHEMVNTRTDAELAAAVQAAYGCHAPTDSRAGASITAANPVRSRRQLAMLMLSIGLPYGADLRTITDVAQVADAARTRNPSWTGVDLIGSDRQGGGGNYRNNNNNNYSRDNNRNSGAGRDQRNRGSQQSRVPSEVYSTTVLQHRLDSRHQERARSAAGTCFKYEVLSHLQRTARRTLVLVVLVMLTRCQTHSGRVLCTYSGSGADTFRIHHYLGLMRLLLTPILLDLYYGISPPMKDAARITHVYRDLHSTVDDRFVQLMHSLDMCEFGHNSVVLTGRISGGKLLPGILHSRMLSLSLSSVFHGLSQSPSSLSSMTPIELNELKDQLQELLERVRRDGRIGILYRLTVNLNKITIRTIPGKVNVVADALSRKSGMIAGIKVEEEIICDLERLNIELCVRGRNGFWASLRFKIEHQRESGLLQPLEMHVWKWTKFMDFVYRENWDVYFTVCGVCYNESVGMRALNALLSSMLFGRKCRALYCGSASGVRILEGQEMIGVD
ncbi:retrotransposon protein, putative, ty3-gypsy subclass [Tanacetum coccineum]|uniref:Retrotransposon protein, putative, ty3-gypsy subclass n=1 Tax=Tanacetum coccineum TaxID=301880 RepID=A0ABQ5AJJ9_9ASTR